MHIPTTQEWSVGVHTFECRAVLPVPRGWKVLPPMEGAADPGPPHTASPSTYAPPRRVRAWNPPADLTHNARPLARILPRPGMDPARSPGLGTLSRWRRPSPPRSRGLRPPPPPRQVPLRPRLRPTPLPHRHLCGPALHSVIRRHPWQLCPCPQIARRFKADAQIQGAGR